MKNLLYSVNQAQRYRTGAAGQRVNCPNFSMKYIPDKNLYKSVMFALDMCMHRLQFANDEKIYVASTYYHVDSDLVFGYVKEELWRLEYLEASKRPNEWHTIYNPYASKLIGEHGGNTFIFICPKCHHLQSTSINYDYQIDRIFTSPCPACGFVDEWQVRHRKG